jgi:hypothetical protein
MGRSPGRGMLERDVGFHGAAASSRSHGSSCPAGCCLCSPEIGGGPGDADRSACQSVVCGTSSGGAANLHPPRTGFPVRIAPSYRTLQRPSVRSDGCNIRPAERGWDNAARFLQQAFASGLNWCGSFGAKRVLPGRIWRGYMRGHFRPCAENPGCVLRWDRQQFHS